MKKRLLVLPLFLILLVTLISAPSNYNLGNDVNYNYKSLRVDSETTRTFLIKNDNGPDFYRTYNNFNKGNINPNTRYVGFNQKGIYGDFDDSNPQPKNKDCDPDCPAGWKCSKTSAQ